MGTAFETGFNEHLWDAYLGWIGLEQYDEANQVGQQFLDRFEAEYGHRPEYYSPLLWRDCAMALLYAFADAAPLSPPGVRAALERVKMLPAASGSPGTRISFGRWMHRGWVGAGYLVARSLDPDGKDLGEVLEVVARGPLRRRVDGRGSRSHRARQPVTATGWPRATRQRLGRKSRVLVARAAGE